MASQTRSVSSRTGGTRTRGSAGSHGGASPDPRSHRSSKQSHRPKGRKPRKNKPRHRVRRVLLWLLGIAAVLLLVGAGVFAYLYVTTEIPPAEKVALSSKTTVYYADGSTEIGSFAEQNREIISCNALPKYVGQAIVSSENRSFYTDKGIDLKGIGRAFLSNITTNSRQGGSTITQQYVKQYYMGETVTSSYSAKLRQAILAVKITQTQSKDQVLCNYMNTIYLGRGAYGIEAAAKAYFNKDAKDLTVSEAAMLAGIIPSPSNWDPAENPKQAQIRFERVLKIMREDGYINGQDASSAKFPQTAQNAQQNTYAGQQGYLLEMVREELTKDKTFTKEELDTGGYKIVTTIDKAKQDLIFQVASPSQDGNGVVPQGLQTGAMSVNPKDGSIISLYAGDDYLTKQLNNATQATYEPGSTMKPFALLAAVQDGMNLNTTFNGNSPRSFDGIASPVQNFGNQSFGYINMYNATANSVNTVYMELQQDLGAKKVAQTANKAGVSANRVKGDNPFTVLGNDGVHVQDITQAFATIANQGSKPTLHIVSKVTDTKGKSMYEAPTKTQRVFAANDTALVTKAMTGTVQYGTATEALSVGRTMAGKSGTANDATAGSFVGFTPDTVSVFAMWYPDQNGNPQEIPPFGIYSGGSDYPVHMFTQYMKQALAGTADQAFPTANDTGKVGGPDGTWGTGSRTWQQQQDQAEAKRKADEQAQQDAQNDRGTPTQTPSSPQPTQTPEDTQSASPIPKPSAIVPAPGNSQDDTSKNSQQQGTAEQGKNNG
ncbi:transglycosylase domain-containing protein [Bifidobacterium subtile]|jgi:membrane peptidoglycan carboxypeptidase|uniref:transglycosylase domain-containing protein n=1 Tax=Bifidobacterium subtile TaxID=77635 RepID=UPI002F3536EF